MNSKKKLNVKIIWNESYLKSIKNSVGSNIFRNFYANVDGKKMDIRKDGQLSCSAFVSSILYLHKLIYDIHATVEGLVKDMELFGWKKIDKPRPGAVLLWEPKLPKNHNDKMYLRHDHIGFYVDNDKAISNRYEKRQPVLHHWTFGVRNGRPMRKVEQIFWNTKLNK
ncbi:MAG: hypothetical protein HYX20_02270 [Candidatus Yanofskybacteria bacterium]|nr:hypothetical protein [Candidatus Yanofskybacteria bacterium]